MVNEGVAALNSLPEAQQLALVRRCCASTSFASSVLALCPFRNHTEEGIGTSLDAAWGALSLCDRLQALPSPHDPPSGTQAREQERQEHPPAPGNNPAGEDEVQDATLRELEQWAQRYEAKFGYGFLICPEKGRCGPKQVLTALRSRYLHHPATEALVATEEARKVSQWRFAQLLQQLTAEARLAGEAAPIV